MSRALLCQGPEATWNQGTFGTTVLASDTQPGVGAWPTLCSQWSGSLSPHHSSVLDSVEILSCWGPWGVPRTSNQGLLSSSGGEILTHNKP